jgi:outer membrane biogenesis lipoprotein LolB
MYPALTQVKSVTSKKYHERFQSTIGMAIPVEHLTKWFTNDTDIGDDEIERTFNKLTEALSVNTAGKASSSFFCPHDGQHWES